MSASVFPNFQYSVDDGKWSEKSSRKLLFIHSLILSLTTFSSPFARLNTLEPTEEWTVEDGQVKVQGSSITRKMKAVAKKKVYEKEETEVQVMEKAGGNTNADGDKYKEATTNFWGKAVSKKEARQYEKAKKKRDVKAMRKILQIPNKKVMPGHEELGDGSEK